MKINLVLSAREKRWFYEDTEFFHNYQLRMEALELINDFLDRQVSEESLKHCNELLEAVIPEWEQQFSKMVDMGSINFRIEGKGVEH